MRIRTFILAASAAVALGFFGAGYAQSYHIGRPERVPGNNARFPLA
jgi:hypothetical protein